VDGDGQIRVPGLFDDVPELDALERAALESLPFDEAEFRRDAGMLEGTRFAGEPDRSVYERIWFRPAIALTALEGMPLATAASQLMADARARVGVRVAPGQDAERVAAAVVEFLTTDPPVGVAVEATVTACVGGWKTRAQGPAFEAAARALESGFGCAPANIGCGGTIPFVAPFAQVLGGVPALLLGLEDPPCNAHGENESLHVEDFRKAIVSATYLLAELSGE
jgi:acetylornithine deacetylase/succinyl-diaminopimelate desuccinylase-like protein